MLRGGRPLPTYALAQHMIVLFRSIERVMLKRKIKTNKTDYIWNSTSVISFTKGNDSH